MASCRVRPGPWGRGLVQGRASCQNQQIVLGCVTNDVISLGAGSNDSEKSINFILDYISTSQQVRILKLKMV